MNTIRSQWSLGRWTAAYFHILRFPFRVGLAVGLGCVAGAHAVDWDQVVQRHEQAEVAAGAPGSGRQYAPSRKMDLLHLALDVTPDFRKRSIAGVATLRFKPIALPLPELELDAVDLDILKVTATAAIADWHATDQVLVITFTAPLAPDQETAVTIEYSATPRQGLYFRTPELGYPAEDTHLWTQGEAISARHWYPGFDAPNEKFTSEVTCRVPAGMTVLSNGRLVSQTNDAVAGRIAVQWRQEQPHANYLITLVAGYFLGLHARHGDLPVAFYTPASQIAYASNSFAGTTDMLAYFEREIGVRYPWAKYDQVCVSDFVASGMENTSQTTLTDTTLHPPEFGLLRSSQGLVAHELAHQWFGDLVTCKDWSHLWINEGFATLYETLYDGHRHGRDEFLYRMHQSARGIFDQPNDTNAIVRRDFNDPNEQFSYLTYPKAAWVLHMLRSQLGPDLFRLCVRIFLERHAYGNAVTEDFLQIVEEQSGRSFDQFFDQWFYHAHHPELDVSYRWEEGNKLARISVRQTQRLSANVLLFHAPLPVRFQGAFGRIDRELNLRQAAEDFHVALPSRPQTVRLDPDLTVLAKVSFHPGAAVVEAQLRDATDMLGRLMAMEEMSGKPEALDVLERTLRNDPFYGVRMAASRGIREIGSAEALQALQRALDEAPADARVRQQLTADLTSMYRAESCRAALTIAARETNPAIQATAIAALGAYATAEVKESLLAHLAAPSFRSVRAVAAIQAMRAQDDPVYLEPLRTQLQTNEPAFTSGGFSAGLETLAWLARNQADRQPVREFLLARVHHPNERVQQAAIAALGTLGDPKAVPALEAFVRVPKDSPVRKSAERAVAALRDLRKPAAELGGLRNEVLELQKANRTLRQEMDELKKKIDALAPREKKPE